MAGKRAVIVGLATNGVFRSGERRQNGCGEVLDARGTTLVADLLTVLLIQDAWKDIFDERSQIQPLVRGVLEAAVVKVVSVDIDTRTQRAFSPGSHTFQSPQMQKPPCGGFCARPPIRSCRTGR